VMAFFSKLFDQKSIFTFLSVLPPMHELYIRGL